MKNEKQIQEAKIQGVRDEYCSQQPDQGEHSSKFFATSCDTNETEADEVILGLTDIPEPESLRKNDIESYQPELQVDTPEVDLTSPVRDERVVKFFETPCCQKKCNRKFGIDEVIVYRDQCTELDYQENGSNLLNSVLLGILRSLSKSESQATHARSHHDRQRRTFNFRISGVPICRNMFLMCHNIRIKRFKNLVNTLSKEGLVLKHHGLRCKLPQKTSSFTQFKTIETFIHNYAEDHALFMPGRLGQQYKLCKLLPSSETKKAVYEKYRTCTLKNNPDEVPVSLWLFRYIWRTCCPDVVISLPRSDLCATCQQKK